MPGIHGRKTSFKLSNLAGVLTDISTYFKSIDFPREAELLETTTFQASDKTYIVGFKDNKISGQGNYDDTIDALLSDILGVGEPTGGTENEGFDFEVGLSGTATGKTKYTGKCYLVKYQASGSVNGVSPVTVELQITGAVTRGTFA